MRLGMLVIKSSNRSTSIRPVSATSNLIRDNIVCWADKYMFCYVLVCTTPNRICRLRNRQREGSCQPPSRDSKFPLMYFRMEIDDGEGLLLEMETMFFAETAELATLTGVMVLDGLPNLATTEDLSSFLLAGNLKRIFRFFFSYLK